MDSASYPVPVAEDTAESRAGYLRRVAAWTFGGLALTAVFSVLSLMFVAPAVFKLGSFGVLVTVYGSFLLSQTLVRRMVYADTRDQKLTGFVVGSALQGVALGFLLLITLALTNAQEGFNLIGNCLAMTVLSALAMLLYVTGARRSFSFLGAGLSMVMLPMLGLMALQLVFPVQGTFGILIAAVFLLVSAGALLYRLNFVVHHMSASMHVEGGYEITLAVVVVFWNLLSLMNRLRRR